MQHVGKRRAHSEDDGVGLMKGITHFVVGVATASCFPAVVVAAGSGSVSHFLLGGIAGLLPDTIDFKFIRFFAEHDILVVSDPLEPDASAIADAIAYAMNKAHETHRSVYIRLNTIPIGSDEWLRYHVRFVAYPEEAPGHGARWAVSVSFGPIVDGGGLPIATHEAVKVQSSERWLPCRVGIEYEASLTIDILEGPLLEMHPSDDGRIVPILIPWHRRFSHSIAACMIVSLCTALLLSPTHGMIVFFAYGAHIAVDQLGYMGSSLFFPFIRGRVRGMRITHSGDGFWNFFLVWAPCLLISWNLMRLSDVSLDMPGFGQVLLFGGVIPISLVAFVRCLLNGPEDSGG